MSASLLPSLAWLFIPFEIFIAILRSRLWDIDAVINRTLVYGSLSASLALVYVAIVVVLQELFRLFAGQSSQLAIALSTLTIAAVFHPLRRVLQTFIDRRFFRSRYDAAQMLGAFQTRLVDEVDLERVKADMLHVVQETVHPAHASLWLRDGEAQK